MNSTRVWIRLGRSLLLHLRPHSTACGSPLRASVKPGEGFARLRAWERKDRIQSKIALSTPSTKQSSRRVCSSLHEEERAGSKCCVISAMTTTSAIFGLFLGWLLAPAAGASAFLATPRSRTCFASAESSSSRTPEEKKAASSPTENKSTAVNEYNDFLPSPDPSLSAVDVVAAWYRILA